MTVESDDWVPSSAHVGAGGGGRRQKRKSVNSSVSSAASLESNVAGDLRRASAAASKMGPVVIGRRQNMKSENSLVESTCMAPQFCWGRPL